MPAIMRIGMKTAISEMLMDKTVKPISLPAEERQQKAAHPPRGGREMLRHHHDGIVNHNRRRNRQGHQREIVDAYPRKHHGEGTDQGTGTATMMR